MQKNVDILGVQFSNLNKKELHNIVISALDQKKQLYLAFANPEYILNAPKSLGLRQYLMFAHYILADGEGIRWASRKIYDKTKWIKERLTGTDFTFDILKILEEKNKKIYILGGSKESNEMAIENAKKLHPKLRIDGRDGYFDELDNDRVIKKINQSRADVLMVCLGNPKQEEWLIQHMGSLKPKIQFGNGGAVDFLAGKVKRAPKIYHDLGLEWFWRLIQDFTFKRFIRQARYVFFIAMVLVTAITEKAAKLNNK